MKLRTAIITCFVLGQLALTSAGSAAPRNLPTASPTGDLVALEGVRHVAYASNGISLDEAVARVRRQTGGRIIKATSRTGNGRTIYHVRVLTKDGRVFTVRVDASSGRIL